MMGGDIAAESEAGKGSTFTINLPAEVVDPRSEEEPDKGPGLDSLPEGAARVLVIDDDPMARDLIQRTLSKEGFGVEQASGGQEGLRLARELRPDAITLDALMPGMDGWAVLAELKGDPDLADIPVVMVTVVDDQNLGYMLGVSEYLVKPVDRERLIAILNRYRKDNQPCSILIVEDDPETRRLVRRILERENWSVGEAQNGRVALERVEKSRPDLILLDLIMPEMDGFEFINQLVGREEWRSIPVVVITAKDLNAEDRRRLNGYVQGVIEKGSYSREELAEKVRDLVTGSVRKGVQAKPVS